MQEHFFCIFLVIVPRKSKTSCPPTRLNYNLYYFANYASITFMINKEDIKNLASLARIGIKEDEAISLTKEIDSILEYVSQIKSFSEELDIQKPTLRNVLRDDVLTNNPNEYTEDILNNAPKREGGYVDVKNIF